MPRVAVVNDIAGVGRLEVAALREAGWDADFFELPKPGASWPAWIKPLALPLRLIAAAPVIARLRRGGYDVVHVHFLSQGHVGSWSGRPFLLHAHGSDLHLNFRNPLARWWSRLWMRRAQRIFFVTPNLATFLNGFEAKSLLLPNPVDTDLYAAAAPATRLDRMLVFMRLAPIKGAEVAFGAVEELRRDVSVSAMDFGPQAAELRRRYAKSVEFLAPVPAGEVPALLARFDGVIGQLEQGVPGLSELEAMASGRVVFMRIDAALFRSDPPPVVAVATSGELVAAVRKTRADAAQVARLAAAGRDWVVRNHGMRAHAQALIEAYAEALKPA